MRWRLLTRRAWHGWCVACVFVGLPETRRCCVCTDHVYDGVVRRGQVVAGLGALRSPAVRNLISSFLLVVAVCPGVAVAVHILVTCVE